MGQLLLDTSETFTDCQFDNGVVINGDPALTMTATVNTDGSGTFQFGGGIKWGEQDGSVGTCQVNVTSILDATGAEIDSGKCTVICQGEPSAPGSSRFYLSLEDDLMRIFGSERISGLMQRLGMEEGVPIEHGMVTRAIERAQKQVEAQNFSVRKHLLEYDDVTPARDVVQRFWNWQNGRRLQGKARNRGSRFT